MQTPQGFARAPTQPTLPVRTFLMVVVVVVAWLRRVALALALVLLMRPASVQVR